MRICFDLQSAVGQRTGVGNYAAHLAEALAEAVPPGEMDFFYFDFKRSGHTVNIPAGSEKPLRWCPGRLMQAAWKKFHYPPYDALAGRYDVYHFPNFIIPPLRAGHPVVTIHDLAFLRMPETIEPKNLRFLTGKMADTVRRASAILAVSQFTADELQELLKVPPERIHVVHEALCDVPEPPPDARGLVRERLGVDRPFLLTVGTVEPRKNYVFLMDVFDSLDADVDLVIAGGCGWLYEPILDRLRYSPKADRIHITGYLERQELAALYAAAELFVYPTRYEGFGFPPLEAMHYGLPVLAAAISPLREVLGDAAEWAPPGDLSAWRHILGGLLQDDTRQDELRRLGRGQTARYSWNRAAAETIEVYRKACRS